ncbi:glycosyltransferase family 2 protein [Streptococcus caprae]|uniref:Glycosyltransferase family 2 protein n=1 Tax=Streptococcus caprae TaxID=1640501 RepID=A0ABV8CVE0_9STRE
MTETPLVSIVCTVYNKAPWLEKTITGFLEQEADFTIEILLVDDASTDGSPGIIKRYAELYPEKIRTFFHSENQGISKTWVSVCQEAKGTYIARADGDDFWIDSQKLQKQVKLLQSTPNSRWSNTDFDIYNEEGEFVSASGFESGAIPLADSFEKMLATRGFTMASTWLVERELMIEVNDLLDLSTSDDTFNLQMDLFQRTELAYLPESTVAYVINLGSDSRPKDFQKLENRFNKLLETQNEYLDKYPQSNYREMLRILLDRNNRYELELTRQQTGLAQLGFERVSIYSETNQHGFTEESALHYLLAKEDVIYFSVSEDCHRIRVDLSERPSYYQYAKLIAMDTETEVLPSYTNGVVTGHQYLFIKPDPQLVYELPKGIYGKAFRLEYKMFDVDNIFSEEYIGNQLAQEVAAQTQMVNTLTSQSLSQHQELSTLKRLVEQQKIDLETITQQYHAVVGSRRWIISTKIINFFRRRK